MSELCTIPEKRAENLDADALVSLVKQTNLYKDLPKETNDLAFSHLGGVPNLHIAAEV